MSRIVLLMLIAFCGTATARGEVSFAANVVRDAEGGVIRGDVEAKRLALMFTGDQFGESATPILDALAKRQIKGSFFLTGGFVKQESLRPATATHG